MKFPAFISLYHEHKEIKNLHIVLSLQIRESLAESLLCRTSCYDVGVAYLL